MEDRSLLQLQFKVTLRIVLDSGMYRSELSFRGARRQFTGPSLSIGEGAMSALREALDALKRPCFVECYLEEAVASAPGWSVPSATPHALFFYYIPVTDDPVMAQLKRGLKQNALAPI